MRALIRLKMVWITCVVWLGLVTLNQLFRGLSVVPVTIDPSSYWLIQISVGILLGACFHVVGRIVILMTDQK